VSTSASSRCLDGGDSIFFIIIASKTRFASPLPARHSSLPYSCRSATIGSTFVARRAAMQQASNATASSAMDTAMKVSGSLLLTP
jgi:hypothetical protein